MTIDCWINILETDPNELEETLQTNDSINRVWERADALRGSSGTFRGVSYGATASLRQRISRIA